MGYSCEQSQEISPRICSSKGRVEGIFKFKRPFWPRFVNNLTEKTISLSIEAIYF
mgnify:CR=1 FL=1